MHRPDQYLASPLGTPDHVVYDEVYCMLFVLIVHVDSIALSTGKYKRLGHSSPFSRDGAFWPISCKRKGRAFTADTAALNGNGSLHGFDQLASDGQSQSAAAIRTM